ncbi:hypothetical protein [Rhizobium leguminosarum]|uniref:hypothetical protein n=1 Tax=Rhizobium leguminosarum TaxID=384 RepID=UPI0021BBE07B|nr:hypothetical protein [Rhizobium leguminosarum]
MLDRQNASISEQLAEVKNDEIAQTAQFDAQIAGYQTQIDKLQSQIALQRELITSIEKDVERIRGLVDKGIVPRRDVTLREDSLTERRQQMAVLESTLTERQSDLSDAERMLDQVKARSNEKVAALQSQREDINRGLATNEQSRAYVIRSPIGGTVSALTAKIGEPLNTQQALMSVVPLNATCATGRAKRRRRFCRGRAGGTVGDRYLPLPELRNDRRSRQEPVEKPDQPWQRREHQPELSRDGRPRAAEHHGLREAASAVSRHDLVGPDCDCAPISTRMAV